jgi:uncharacterized metal-binding protein YceD (DUF177 family)
LKDYLIQFRGLSIGNHEFEFKVNNTFFEAFNYSELKAGELDVKLNFEKQETMLVIDFSLNGFVNVICDRCLEDFDFPINHDVQLIVQFGASFQELSEEIVVIPENAYEIDVAPYIYEYINLALPIQKIHQEDSEGNSQCVNDMTDKLDELSGEQQIDPRWEALKNLKDKID